MATMQKNSCCEAIRRTLERRAGIAPDASTVAEATLNTWRQMAAALAPLIGTRGVDALFGRSFQVTSKTFPWLADHGMGTEFLTKLRTSLMKHETNTAMDASCVLLTTFTELLEALIGESLAERMLDPVWEHSLATSTQENHHEQQSGDTPTHH